MTQTKFLCITLDNSLKWKPHIDHRKIKLSKLTGIICRVRDSLNREKLRQMYLSLTYPHPLYGSALWGGAFKTYIDSLFIQQKKLVRIMSHSQRYDHTHPFLTSLKLLKLPDILYLQTCVFVYGALHLFPKNCNFHILDRNNTCNVLTLQLPLCRTSQAQQSIQFRGPKLWNQLQNYIGNIHSCVKFKQDLQNAIVAEYN